MTRRRPSPTAPGPFCSSLLLAVLLLLAPARVARAQDGSAPSSDEVISVRTDLVTVPVSVSDAKGRRVAGLTQQEFEVLDEGRRVEVAYFASGAERVALLFLLDASGSTRDIVTQQRETALALFSRFGAGSRLSVVAFREQPEVLLPFTTEARRAQAAFRFPVLPERRTAIFDAALAAVRDFPKGAPQPAERRIVILVSDGLDTASATSAAEVVKEAKAYGVSFYVIHLPLYAPAGDRLAPRAPAKGFRELAEKTGGQFFVIGDARAALNPRAEFDLQPVFRAIAEDLQGQYVLGYHAGDIERGKRLHRVEVRLTAGDKRNLRVRSLREGYEIR